MVRISIIILAIFLVSASPKLQGDLSGNKVITSKVLGYDLRYRVYTPPGYQNEENLPVIYLTDGQWYISEGEMPKIMDELILSKTIQPVIAIFVDNRDPHNLSDNRRNSQFLGNDDYVKFYQTEFVPFIDKEYKTSGKQADRAIMGLSFGALNATYFGAKASGTFHMLGIQSPALHPVPNIYSMYSNQEVLPLKIFLSTGTKNDTEGPARKLRKTLEDSGYDFKYIEVPEGHNWRNWKPLLDDTLIYFFGASDL